MNLRWKSTDEEKRILTIKLKASQRAHKKQKDKNEKLLDEIEALSKEIKNLKKALELEEKQIETLEAENKKIRTTNKKLQGMLFKTNSKQEETKKGKIISSAEDPNNQISEKKKRGAQKGNTNHKFSLPAPDKTVGLHLCECPDCHTTLKTAKKTARKIIMDIPDLSAIKCNTVEYQIERQYCPNCKKEVKATVENAVPNSNFGLNVSILIMILKYEARIPIRIICSFLKYLFNIKISTGNVEEILQKGAKMLLKIYEDILEIIRGSPLLHADETTWKINKEKYWLWVVISKLAVLIRIVKSRGKKEIHKIIGIDKITKLLKIILVTDDYVVYESLGMERQSCWSHLLRESNTGATDEKASTEIKDLHKELTNMFEELTKIIESPFEKKTRMQEHKKKLAEIEKICEREYKETDAKKVQTRIRNQRGNLITALKYADVPLTNNLAERCIRPSVIIRKISGGSRSKEGARTHEIMMSVIQTIKMRKEDVYETLTKYLKEAIQTKDYLNVNLSADFE
ncbi:MAG: IS66 family transposase [Candidatus Nomurabacteria bacterium]